MNKHAYKELSNLHSANIEVQETNQIRFNSGSETAKHVVAKALVGHVAIQNGYRVSSEVETPHGEIDTLIWGHPERSTYAVECEASPTKDVLQDKLNRYVLSNAVIADMLVVNLNEMPMEVLDAIGFVREVLGLHE